MSTYVPTRVGITSITLPADGEDVDAASVNVPLEAVADGVYTITPTPTCEVDPDSVRFWSGLLSASPAFASLGTLSIMGSTDIENSHTQLGAFVTKTVSTMADARVFYIPLPDLGRYNSYTLVSAALRVKGKAGHAGVPGMPPRIALVRFGASATTGLLAAGWTVDAPADAAAYETEHAITQTTDQNRVIDTSQYRYALLLQNEGSTNATNGLEVRRLILTLTAPT